MGNVFARMSGVDITMEMLYAAPYSNLFTDINIGAGTQPFGWVVRGQDHTSYNTWWNIRTANGKPFPIPPTTWGPKATFVNVQNSVGVSAQRAAAVHCIDITAHVGVQCSVTR